MMKAPAEETVSTSVVGIPAQTLEEGTETVIEATSEEPAIQETETVSETLVETEVDAFAKVSTETQSPEKPVEIVAPKDEPPVLEYKIDAEPVFQVAVLTTDTEAATLTKDPVSENITAVTSEVKNSVSEDKAAHLQATIAESESPSSIDESKDTSTLAENEAQATSAEPELETLENDSQDDILLPESEDLNKMASFESETEDAVMSEDQGSDPGAQREELDEPKVEVPVTEPGEETLEQVTEQEPEEVTNESVEVTAESVEATDESVEAIDKSAETTELETLDNGSQDHSVLPQSENLAEKASVESEAAPVKSEDQGTDPGPQSAELDESKVEVPVTEPEEETMEQVTEQEPEEVTNESVEAINEQLNSESLEGTSESVQSFSEPQEAVDQTTTSVDIPAEHVVEVADENSQSVSEQPASSASHVQVGKYY